MGSTKDILTGISQRIAGAGLGIVWNASATYTATQTGIFWKLVPVSPDRVVVLTLVDLTDHVTQPFGSKMLQVRARGLPNNPTDVDDLLDGIFDVLHGTTYLTFGAQSVVQLNRQTAAPLGMDDSKRWERADQYYMDVSAPPTVNRPAGGSW